MTVHITGMQMAGPAADRWGSDRTVFIAGLILALGVICLGTSDGLISLIAALVVFGLGHGATDVSMNTQAVQVELTYRRPIMATFHAMFSVGGVVGSLLGAATLAAGWTPLESMSTAAILAAVIVVVCRRALLRPRSVVPEKTADDPKSSQHVSIRIVLALATIAFSLFLAEGAANDWSSLQVEERFETTDTTAAFAYGVFAVTMTIGRLTADRVAASLGPVAVVRYGSLLAATGIALVIASHTLWLTLTGWAIFGLGLSGGIPQIFTAAGRIDTSRAGTNLSRIVGAGYLGFLAGPALLGLSTTFVPLTTALILPLALLLIAMCFGSVVKPRTEHEPTAPRPQRTRQRSGHGT